MKQNYNKKRINLRPKQGLLSFFLFAMVAVFVIVIATHNSDIKKSKITQGKTEIFDSNDSQNQSVKAAQNNNVAVDSSQAFDQSNLTNLKIPILMYHHIRDFNDSSNKIGTNLSVSPATLSEQLDSIKQKGYTTITFNDLTSGKIPEKPIILTFDDGYLNFYQNAYPELKNRDMKAVSFIITGYIGGSDYMNERQIKEISDYGIEIGSHTVSHPDLSTLSEKLARQQIFDSKKTLENILSKSIVSFCYPSGKYTSQTESLVEKAGYSFATTTKGGITTFGDFFALNRYRVDKDTNISVYIK